VASQTRRRVLHAVMGSVAGASVGLSALRFTAARAQAAPDTVITLRLSDDLYMLTAGQTNAVARTEPDGVVLVDGASAGLAGALSDAIEGLPASGPIHTLFNTHWHPEHTGLNERLGSAGAAIIAQENTRLWLTTDITYPWDGQHFEPLPEVARPNQTFYAEGDIDSGVRYGYLRHAAHTDGDLYVYFPEANVLAVGDAVSGAGWPLVDWWTGGWIGGIVGGWSYCSTSAMPKPASCPRAGRCSAEPI